MKETEDRKQDTGVRSQEIKIKTQLDKLNKPEKPNERDKPNDLDERGTR